MFFRTLFDANDRNLTQIFKFKILLIDSLTKKENL